MKKLKTIDIEEKIKFIYGDLRNSDYSLENIERSTPVHIIYFQIYDEIGHMFTLDYTFGTYLNPEYNDESKPVIGGIVDNNRTFINVIEYLKKNRIGYYSFIIYNKPAIFTVNGFCFYVRYGDFTIIAPDDKLPQWVMDCIAKKSSEKKYKYVVHGNSGFETFLFKAKEMSNDFDLNYNDDLPVEKLTEIFDADTPALVVLHGVPGTGKTSFIRSLINDTDKKYNILYVDQTCFGALTDSSFINLLTENKNSIIVLEDCEDLLTARDGCRSNSISSLLNITDGIIGDAFNLKIICTFNMDLGKIDSALLRKGRLKLKYEFKPLTKDKVRTFFEKMYPDETEIPEKEMTLADLYNYMDVNDLSSKKKKSVGFNQV